MHCAFGHNATEFAEKHLPILHKKLPVAGSAICCESALLCGTGFVCLCETGRSVCRYRASWNVESKSPGAVFGVREQALFPHGGVAGGRGAGC